MAEGAPKAFSKPVSEETTVQSPERIPSYLEDPDVRQKRDIETLKTAVTAQFETLARSPEFSSLDGDALLEKVSDIGIKSMLDLVSEKYDYPDNVDTKLAFHNREHSQLVVDRLVRLVDAANRAAPGTVSLQEKMEGKLAAASHDADHVFFQDGSRKRKAGDGEERSAARLTALKEALNDALVTQGKTALYEIDGAKDKQIIDATVPGFDPQMGVTQINLNEKTPLIGRFLALADLGDFGMNGGNGLNGVDKLLRSGRQLAIEDNSDIVEAERSGLVPEEAKEGYAKRLKGFMLFQSGFAASRKNQFERELNGITDPAVRDAVVAEFPNFEEEAYAQAQAELAEKLKDVPEMDYDQIVEFVGVRRFVNGHTI